MRYEDMKARLNEAVATIPRGSANEVAFFLKQKGIKGRRRAPYDCPIVRYVRSVLGPEFATTRIMAGASTTSGMGTVYIVFPMWGAEGNIASDYHPSIGEFISMFDNGRFPDLIAE